FDFIRYIEKLKKYDTDFGEAAKVGENDDTVRIMSIHKSKGLEFPVVFLAGAGKGFNKQDSRGKILIDEELGIATDFLDPKLKIKASTLKKNVLSRRSDLESMGEELRILYVAMTRAKEKLIITAGSKYLESRLEKFGNLPDSAFVGTGLPFTYLSAANSYLEWILMAARKAGNSMEISRVPISELVQAEIRHREEKADVYAMLQMLRETDGDCGDFGPMLDYQYPYTADIALHAKMSVSELKHQGQFADDEESDVLPTIPEFMRKCEQMKNLTEEESVEPSLEDADLPRFHGTENAGTYRGTAYHRVMELIDFTSVREKKDVYRELKRIREAEMMDERALNLVRADKIWNFFQSGIAKRMQTADAQGLLRKESQFVIGIPASLMDEADSDEPVIIQGIIDVWFEEDGELVLVDYKTDRVEEGNEQMLLDRYQIQMVYYAQALQQITQKKVKEAVIYSLALQKEVTVDILL
ncbi:MAG: PD-(D/E)XK nuclease family protein, partial [Lachnospiraceae bacterium]|nr:PD-(D/E)XK nuclease family protein [Lachnospiraceae bacterium]